MVRNSVECWTPPLSQSQPVQLRIRLLLHYAYFILHSATGTCDCVAAALLFAAVLLTRLLQHARADELRDEPPALLISNLLEAIAQAEAGAT